MISINKLFAAFSIFMLAVITTRAQKSAGEYLEVIGNEFNGIQTKTWDYTSTVAHGKSAKKVEKTRRDVVMATTAAIRKIQNLKAFEGSTSLRDSALAFLKINHAVLNEDYAKLMDMEEVSEESYDAMEAYMLAREKANDKLHAAGVMIEGEYNRFARENNITLIEGNAKLAKKLEIAGKVYDHYNEVYLVFFKSYKQEAYLMTAMEKNDVNGIEQNKNALMKTATECIEKLKTFKAYENDESLKKACLEVLEFYKDEAGNKFAGISKFYVSKENFEKIKAAFDATPANKRTQGDVDKYNNAVNEYNNASNEYNRINQELNNRRAQLVDNWNRASDKFTDRHVPKR